jgi:hypothetical protein
MKTKIILTALAAISLAACQNHSTGSSDFIPGTYVNQSQSEFSIANDTLVIAKAPNTDYIYLITRRTGYRRIGNGKLNPVKHEVKHLTGEWDPVKQVMQLMQNGTTLIFQPDQHKLFIGTNTYWKL